MWVPAVGFIYVIDQTNLQPSSSAELVHGNIYMCSHALHVRVYTIQPFGTDTRSSYFLFMHSVTYLYGMHTLDRRPVKAWKIVSRLCVIMSPVLFEWKSLGMHYSYYGQGRKEGNVLFNDALNTFYLRL